MKTQRKIYTVLAVVIVVTIVGLGLYVLIQASGTLIGSLDNEASRRTLMVCITLLLCAVIIARGMFNRQPSHHIEHSAKVTLYERVLSAWCEAQRNRRATNKESLDEIERLLVLQAHRNVLNAYLDLRKIKCPYDITNTTTQSALQRLINEMRKDLGHHDSPWPATTVTDLILRPDDPSQVATPASGQFKVMDNQ